MCKFHYEPHWKIEILIRTFSKLIEKIKKNQCGSIGELVKTYLAYWWPRKTNWLMSMSQKKLTKFVYELEKQMCYNSRRIIVKISRRVDVGTWRVPKYYIFMCLWLFILSIFYLAYLAIHFAWIEMRLILSS